MELYKNLKLRFIKDLFFLRKWRTNDEKLRYFNSLINEKDDTLHTCKILGILWSEINDALF